MDLTNTLYQTLIASSVIFIISLVVMLIFTKSPNPKSNQPIGDRNEPYLGGEKQPFNEESINPGNLFLSIVNQSLKKAYQKIVNRYSTFSVNEWMFNMSIWLAFLIILLIMVVIVL